MVPVLACPRCRGPVEPVGGTACGAEMIDGELRCVACDGRYPVIRGVPHLLPGGGSDATARLYSDIWAAHEHPGRTPRPASRGYRAPATSHAELLRLASGHDIVAPGIGLDAGCGSAGTAIALAAAHPEAHVVGVDLSEGPLLRADAACRLPNADLVRGDLLAPPFARSAFDFVYSFGVLHHTADPRRGFAELVQRLRPGGRITVFVYKDFSDLPAKRFLLLQVNRLRTVTTRLPPATLRLLSWMVAPVVLGALVIPARVLRAAGLERTARHIPYGTFPGLRAVASSIEDRFGAPHEFRFSRAELERWVEEEGLDGGRVVDCLPWGFSGLVMTGTRRV